MTEEVFANIRFKSSLRPSQVDAVAIARREIEAGQKRLHIVAPPGSGKTVLGLYLWAHCVKRPALVLAPNSAIQAQWAARTDLFEFPGLDADALVSTDPNSPALLTSLTYQSVTLPQRGGDQLDLEALALWREKLIDDRQAEDPDEADVWISDLQRHNPDYYDRRLSAYRKQIRDQVALGGEALRTLHRSSLETLGRLGAQKIGLIIFDECHHLLGHWGRVLADAHDMLDQPIVIGLTATPPDRTGKSPIDIERYDTFFGPIDYEVPVPAVVKDGFLAPYQDLAYFVRPTSDELKFIAGADQQLHEIIEQLCTPREHVEPSADELAHAPSNFNHDDSNESEVVATETASAAEPDVADSPTDRDETIDEVTSIEPEVSIEQESVAEALPPLNLTDWVARVLSQRRLPVGVMKDWKSFEKRDAVFATAARLFLLGRRIDLPAGVPDPVTDLAPSEMPEMEVLVPVLDRYVRHHLRRSPAAQDRELADHVTTRMRMLGVQITEMGTQACASPVGRVLAYSRSKAQALVPILRAERETLGDAIRAVVVCDYEKTSAVMAEVKHLLDRESGGAVAAFKALLSHAETDLLDPILVTGSSVLVDDDLADRFDAAAKEWLSENGYEVELSFGEEDGFHIVNGKGKDWCPRVYVQMITDLFQRGVTKCLVGTRGLLGEGWDANKINVLVDLTTATTSMTVNQLRGRSIRLDPAAPDKLADNWDVVCLAQEFSKGLDDYKRFIGKHQHLYGATDDGAIEKGVGHVHAALTEIRPEGLEGSAEVLNADMLARVGQRARNRTLWRIGQPYHDQPVRALEARPIGDRAAGFPPFQHAPDPWAHGSLTEAIGHAVLSSLIETQHLAQRRQIHVGERAGGYVRVFLRQAGEEENLIFTTALHEALGPLHNPRYVIPRDVDMVDDTWLSRILPSIVGKYFQRRWRTRAMLHAVPTLLAKNKETVAIYEKHWNHFVSPGAAVYVHRGPGEQLLEEARRAGQVPTSEIHEKEIFI